MARYPQESSVAKRFFRFLLEQKRLADADLVVAANGTMLWVAAFDQTSTTAWERASWVATDSAGNAIVCGTLMSGYSNPVEAASIVMKFAPNGAMAWRLLED